VTQENINNPSRRHEDESLGANIRGTHI